MLIVRFILSLILPVIITACNQEPPQPIQWQLPLTTATDPHRATHNTTLPNWASLREGSVHLRLLSTTSGKQYPLLIPMRGEASAQDIIVRLTGLANGLRTHSGGLMFDDPEVTNPAAFIEIHRNQKLLFSGWIYREFPEMFTPDIAGWKFFLDDAIIRPLSHQTEPQS